MGLLGKLFGKDKDDKIEEPVQTQANIGTFDRFDFHYDDAEQIYCQSHGKSREELEEEDANMISLYAANHIGMFMTWIIDNHYEGADIEDDTESLEAVRSGTMPGADFLMENCDGKFWGSDLNEEIFSFAKWYYDDDDENRYFKDYCNFIENVLNKELYEFVGTWDDYQKLKPIIDAAYKQFKA